MQPNNTKIMYNEVYDFLNILGEKYIKKIPVKFYDFIKAERIENYDVKWDITKDVSMQLSEDALALISYLNLTYWCNEEEKVRLEKIYHDNDEESKTSYNLEEILNQKRNITNKTKEENKELIIVNDKKENILQKIINKIKKIFS